MNPKILPFKSFAPKERKKCELIPESEEIKIHDLLQTWILDIQTTNNEEIGRMMFLCVSRSPAQAASQFLNYYGEGLIYPYLNKGEKKEVLNAIKFENFDFDQMIELLNKENDLDEVQFKRKITVD